MAGNVIKIPVISSQPAVLVVEERECHLRLMPPTTSTWPQSCAESNLFLVDSDVLSSSFEDSVGAVAAGTSIQPLAHAAFLHDFQVASILVTRYST